MNQKVTLRLIYVFFKVIYNFENQVFIREKLNIWGHTISLLFSYLSIFKASFIHLKWPRATQSSYRRQPCCKYLQSIFWCFQRSLLVFLLFFSGGVVLHYRSLKSISNFSSQAAYLTEFLFSFASLETLSGVKKVSYHIEKYSSSAKPLGKSNRFLQKKKTFVDPCLLSLLAHTTHSSVTLWVVKV